MAQKRSREIPEKKVAGSGVKVFDLGSYISGIEQARDVVQGVKLLPSDSVSLVIADPPYCINLAKWDMEDSPVCKPPFAMEWISECARVLKPGGHLLLWGSSVNAWLYTEHELVMKTGLKFVETIIWQYPGFNRTAMSKLWNTTDICLWYTKPPLLVMPKIPLSCASYAYTDPVYFPNKDQPLTSSFKTPGLAKQDKCIYNVISYPREIPAFRSMCKDKTVAHPSMKPIGLAEMLITLFTQSPMDVVLVPFAGSGTELIAAAMHNRPAIGFELSPMYINLIQCRIEEMNDFLDKAGVYNDDRWKAENAVGNKQIVRVIREYLGQRAPKSTSSSSSSRARKKPASPVKKKTRRL